MNPESPESISNEQLISPEGLPIVITSHAIERLKERWRPLDRFDPRPETDGEWLERLKSLFAESKPGDIPPHRRIHRIINNDFEIASYFINDLHKLRFVIIESEGKLILKTVEKK